MSHNLCPCCGSSRAIVALALDDEFLTARRHGKTIVLGPQQFWLLKSIHLALPRPARIEWLAEEAGVRPASVRQLVNRMRTRILPLGLQIIAPVSVGDRRAGGDPGGFYLLQDIDPVSSEKPLAASAVRRNRPIYCAG